MIENKRYQLRQEQLDYPIVNFCCDLVDTENNDKVICFFELDVGTEKMVDLLNEQDDKIRELQERNDRQRERLDSLYQLIFNRDYDGQEELIKELEESERLLQQEMKLYCR